MLFHFLKGWDYPSPADHLPLLLVLDDNGRGRADAVKGSLGQAFDRVQIVIQNGHPFLLQLLSNLFDSGAFRAFRCRKNFYESHFLLLLPLYFKISQAVEKERQSVIDNFILLPLPSLFPLLLRRFGYDTGP
jgi:hypothetical protein